VIACEDTRHSQNLLNHLGISKRLIACHAHNEDASAVGIVKLLDQGQTVAYVSDAGTPGVSDPGARVVGAARSGGHEVVPIPGPSALAALVSVASFTGKSFTFEGFLSPRKGRRKKRLTELLERDEAFVIYESPYRIVEVLGDLASLAPGRRLLVGREMTKAFEEFVEGPAEQLFAEFSGRPSVKGEFAVCVSPAAADSILEADAGRDGLA
jgi:16S rRNA (cytidine1402-2'-O)-methyltransferase